MFDATRGTGRVDLGKRSHEEGCYTGSSQFTMNGLRPRPDINMKCMIINCKLSGVLLLRTLYPKKNGRDEVRIHLKGLSHEID